MFCPGATTIAQLRQEQRSIGPDPKSHLTTGHRVRIIWAVFVTTSLLWLAAINGSTAEPTFQLPQVSACRQHSQAPVKLNSQPHIVSISLTSPTQRYGKHIESEQAPRGVALEAMDGYYFDVITPGVCAQVLSLHPSSTPYQPQIVQCPGQYLVPQHCIKHRDMLDKRAGPTNC